jgi:hypothetical protein
MNEKETVWVSTISESRYPTYAPCINTWDKLPGRKIMFAEGSFSPIDAVEVVDFKDIVFDNCKWLSKKRPNKATRFWFKAMTIYHALKEKYSRYIVWIDADVMVIESPVLDVDLQGNPFAAMHFVNGGVGATPGIESGLMIFDTEHPEIDILAEEYISFWEEEKLFDLRRPYDTCVIDEIAQKYGFLNLVPENTKKLVPGSNSFEYTELAKYLIHHIGKDNKEIL